MINKKQILYCLASILLFIPSAAIAHKISTLTFCGLPTITKNFQKGTLYVNLHIGGSHRPYASWATPSRDYLLRKKIASWKFKVNSTWPIQIKLTPEQILTSAPKRSFWHKMLDFFPKNQFNPLAVHFCYVPNSKGMSAFCGTSERKPNYGGEKIFSIISYKTTDFLKSMSTSAKDQPWGREFTVASDRRSISTQKKCASFPK